MVKYITGYILLYLYLTYNIYFFLHRDWTFQDNIYPANSCFFLSCLYEHLFRKISYQNVMQQHIKIIFISILSINFLMCKSFKDYLNSVSLASFLWILKVSFHKIYKVLQIILLVFRFYFILDSLYYTSVSVIIICHYRSPFICLKAV